MLQAYDARVVTYQLFSKVRFGNPMKTDHIEIALSHPSGN